MARSGRVLLRLLLVAGAAASGVAAHAADVPTVRLGEGRSMVVEYDRGFVPLRRFVGLEKPVDVTPLADGSILMVDEDAHRVLLVGDDGKVEWSEKIGNHPIRARPRRGGGLVVTGYDEIVLTDEQRSVVWTRQVPRLRVAVELANGDLLVAYNTSQGFLEETTRDGEVRWRSRPNGWTGADGRWVDEDPDKTFQSVYTLDVAADGTIFTTDFDNHELRLLSPAHELLWKVRSIRHVTDTRIGPRGELIAVSPEDYAVWFRPPDGGAQTFSTEQRPLCANVTARGTLLVGLVWEPEGEALYATEAKRMPVARTPWWRRGLPVPLLALAVSLALALALRWGSLSRMGEGQGEGDSKTPQQSTVSSRESRDFARTRKEVAERSIPLTPALSHPGEGAEGMRASPPRTRLFLSLLLLAVLAASGAAAWHGIDVIDRLGFRREAWWFFAGCALGGLALRLLDSVSGVAATLTDFVPGAWRAPARHGDRVRAIVLLALALGAVAACLWVLRYRSDEQAIAAGAWVAAQVWILAAAFPPLPAREPASRAVRLLAAVVVLVAIATRFWQIGEYPDYVHHDHGMFGHEVLRAWRGEWTPFFTRIYSVGRPWFLPVIAGFELFGPRYWILRFTAAASGVAAVWATYLLGGALFRPRVGLIAAVLVAANHVLLLYSRQPYVIDPVAPFVLALWAAAVGLQRGSRFHWCLAGVLAAWSLLGYYASVTYALVGAALLAYIACVHPRAFWRARTGVLWMLAGVSVAYLPMVANLGESITVQRAASVVVLLNPDGSIRWDAALWAEQIGNSFGAILRWYSSEYAWGVSAGRSMCLPLGACLFGFGLVCLILRRWTPATFLLLVWPIICIFFGSATLPSPPTPYHFLAAVVPILIASAVALDRFLAVGDALPHPLLRLVPRAAALALLAALVAGHLEASWSAVKRPPPADDGQPVYRAGADVLAARFIRDHPRYRHYLVRARLDVSAPSALFRFFASDSDLSDVTTDLASSLPVAPVEGAEGASFLVLPSRGGERGQIKRIYPQAQEIRVHSYAPDGDLWAYLVDAEGVREAWEKANAASRG